MVNGMEINKVSRFQYLGRILDDQDNDSHAAYRQLSIAREKWGKLSDAIRYQGARATTRGYFYKAIIQAILLYGSDTWTLTEVTLRPFRSFHARVGRHLTGKHIRQLTDGTWHYPSTTEVLRQAGLETIDVYIQRRRDTIWNYAYGRGLYQECRKSTPLSTDVNKVVWWDLQLSTNQV